MYERDLHAMRDEVASMEESLIWKTLPGVTNPPGVLAMHVCGNLQYFIGGVLGDSGYVRNRELEFTITGASKESIIKEIDQTTYVVIKTLNALSPERLSDEMPNTPPMHKGKSVEYFLIQMALHLARHKGQMNYLYRISAQL